MTMQRILSWIVGGDASCQLRVEAPGVAPRHCRLILDGQGFRLLKLHSSAEILVNGRPVQSAARITPSDVVTLGPAFRMPWPERAAAAAIECVFWNGPEMILGRDPACHGVIDSPAVSPRHALIRRQTSGLVVEDLNSAGGTRLNGQGIASPTPARLGDRLAIGPLEFTITALGLERPAERAAETPPPVAPPRNREQGTRSAQGVPFSPQANWPSLEARDLTVEVPGRRLLEDVSLAIHGGEFVGLMGPSGAGKTTLISALNGYAPPTFGQVLFNGHDLYETDIAPGRSIGYVPQDDIMHRELTVAQALRYTAGLRFGPDVSGEEIDERIEDVLEKLGLQTARDTRIGSPERKGISGGQRKRVNLAMELLTDPLALLLDEPTSGLSSEDALRVMTLLRQVADSGKIVLVTVHQPSLEAYRLLDSLALVAKDPTGAEPGQLVYYGPAYPDAPAFFNPERSGDSREPLWPEDIFRGLARRPVAEWLERYAKSRYGRDWATRRARGELAGAGPNPVAGEEDVSPLVQWETLVRRLVRIKISDRWNTAILLVQAPIVAVALMLVFGAEAKRPITTDSWPQVNGAVAMSLFLAGLSALWFGCSNAVREIVGEWAIYHRERMVGLSIPAYVLSKLAVGGALCAVQCAILVGIVRWGLALRAPPLGMYLVMMALAMTGLAMGLLISALARSNEVAIGLVPLALIPIVVFGGALLPTATMQAPIRALAYALPLRSGYEALMLAEAQKSPRGPSLFSGALATGSGVDDPARPDLAELHFPRSQRIGVPASVLILAGMFVAQVVAIGVALRLRDVR